MPVQVQQEELEPCRVALTIDVPPEDYQKASEAVFNQMARRTNVPGFRPGKAPRHLLKRVIDEGRVRELAYERVVGDAFRDAIRQSGLTLYPDANPEVDLPEGDVEPEQGFSFKATVALRPHVHLGELGGLTARKVKMTVTDEDVEKELDRYREQAATYVPTDEPSADGDRVRATAEVSVDGDVVPDLSFSEPTLFELGANLEQFDEGLRGIAAGEERTFDFTFPEELGDEELRGKTATARVNAVEVQRRTLPEINEELAQANGFETVAALQERTRELMQQQADLLAEQEVNDSLLREVIRRSTIHYPSEMVQRDVSSRLQSLIAALEERGFTLDQYLTANKTDLATYQGQLQTEVTESVEASLTMLALADANQIRVTDQDVEGEVKLRAESEGVKLSQMRRLLADTGELDAIRNRVFRRKVAEFLRSDATITEVDG